jgi:3-dehydroquinate synthase
MTEVAVDLGARGYAVHVGHGALAILPAVVGAVAPARAVVVSSPTVWGHHGAAVEAALGRDVRRVLVSDAESRKSRRTLDRIHDAFVDGGLGRDGLVIAFGGGVVGDMAGFAAATYMRGVDWIVAPTTLLSMVDSSIGGKVGINHPRAKNLIGAFHQPRAVIADLALLSTLPRREARSGAYEILKCGVIADADLFAAIAHAPAALASWPGLEAAVTAACRVKARIVAADEREGGVRRHLNFGHTIGHALETVTAYRGFTHGEAVGWGMIGAASIAGARGLLPDAERAEIAAAVDALGRRPSLARLDEDAILAALARDKKARAGRVPFILPTRIGEVIVEPDVATDEIRDALRGMGVGGQPPED